MAPTDLRVRRDTLRADGVAGVVLGVESVPDGLAAGLLAGVNPVYGLYAYLVGTVTGALATSSAFMTVQATGAMAIVVADVTAIDAARDPGRALFTLALLTGVVMIAAGLLRLGSVLRFISNAVLVWGFINAVGVNIILGQLDNFTGYASSGANRVLRAVDTVANAGLLDARALAVGVATIVLIVALERTRLAQLGMVVAIVLTSAWVIASGWEGVARLSDVAEVPQALPAPVLPDLGLVLPLAIPAVSLAFAGLVQGAGITANFLNPDGSYPDASRATDDEWQAARSSTRPVGCGSRRDGQAARAARASAISFHTRPRLTDQPTPNARGVTSRSSSGFHHAARRRVSVGGRRS